MCIPNACILLPSLAECSMHSPSLFDVFCFPGKLILLHARAQVPIQIEEARLSPAVPRFPLSDLSHAGRGQCLWRMAPFRLRTGVPILAQSIWRRPVRYTCPNLTRSPTLEYEPRFFQVRCALCSGGGPKLLLLAAIPSICNMRWWVCTFLLCPTISLTW
jgi:hypothetical protein